MTDPFLSMIAERYPRVARIYPWIGAIAAVPASPGHPAKPEPVPVSALTGECPISQGEAE